MSSHGSVEGDRGVNNEQPGTGGEERFIHRAPVPGGSRFDTHGFRSLRTVLWAIALASRRPQIAAFGWRWPEP